MKYNHVERGIEAHCRYNFPYCSSCRNCYYGVLARAKLSYRLYGEKDGERDLTKVSERLVKLRGKKSREEVAKAVGVSVSAISMYENGERVPRDAIKVELAKFYKTTVQEIFFN